MEFGPPVDTFRGAGGEESARQFVEEARDEVSELRERMLVWAATEVAGVIDKEAGDRRGDGRERSERTE